jgi:protein-S-isoprenylcysteine O-methyltransferase Ste14
LEAVQLYRVGVVALAGGAVGALLLVSFVTAPYGRHQRPGFGPSLDARLGWFVMELPAALVFALVYARGAHALDAAPLALLALWQAHYLQRSLVFPLLMRAGNKRNSLLTVALSFAFNCANGGLNALAVSHLAPYPAGWLADPRLLAGVSIFALGMWINLRADAALRRLRAPGESGYKIPRGGLFEVVTSPNYLGEIIEWCGWALASWSAAGAAFALFTVCNLVPRAVAHRRWYRERFPDYPPERRAVIPGIL